MDIFGYVWIRLSTFGYVWGHFFGYAQILDTFGYAPTVLDTFLIFLDTIWTCFASCEATNYCDILLDTIFGYALIFGYDFWIRARFDFGYVWIRLDTPPKHFYCK